MKYKKIAFLFPGQGAQSVGMGKDFYDKFAEAKKIFDEGEAVLQTPIKNIIFEGPEEILKETRHSQIAIYLTSMALYAVLKAQFPHITPYITAGLSLGEYSALMASQRISFTDSLALVYFRGQYMHDACEENIGAMAAILGLSSEVVSQMVKELALPNDLWIANYNSFDQTVISGTLKGVEKGTICAKAKGAKRVIPLKVHGAFHSGMMNSAKERLKQHIIDLDLKESAIRFVMNVTGSMEENNMRIAQLLRDQVTEPVQWEKTMMTMKQEGIDLFLEIGPGKILSGLAKQNGIEAPVISINKIEDLDTLNNFLSLS